MGKTSSVRFFCFCIFLGLSFIVSTAFAQEEKTEFPAFNSDRPGFSYSAQVLTPGKLVLQTGYLYQKSGERRIDFSSGYFLEKAQGNTGDLLVRYGLIKNIEIGLGAAYQRLRTYRENYLFGLQPQNHIDFNVTQRNNFLTAPIFIIRGQIWEETDALPALNIQYQWDRTTDIISNPDGPTQFNRVSNNNTFRVALAKSLGEHLGIATNINVPADGSVANYTLNLGYSFFNGGVFAEAFGAFDEQISSEGNQAVLFSWNTGAWFRTSANTRLDIGLGHFAGFYGSYFGAVGVTFNLNE